jgi:hypothetical protein
LKKPKDGMTQNSLARYSTVAFRSTRLTGVNADV